MALGWLETCMLEHQTCGADVELQFVPTRLVQVGISEGSLTLQLVNTNDWPSLAMREVNYLALSYCWGTDRGKTVAKTTRANLAQFLEFIDPVMLPRTFQDAMHVVWNLDYRYIWIDALCIVQDDAADLVRECAQMGEIYKNALFTICVSQPKTSGASLIQANRLRRHPRPTERAAASCRVTRRPARRAAFRYATCISRTSAAPSWTLFLAGAKTTRKKTR
jgi:hypothetical protein